MNDFTAGKVRIGDAQRDGAAAALGEHYSEGRLDRAEFDARLAQALSARTRDDLAALFADLPGNGELVEAEAQPPAAAGAYAAAPRYFPLALVIVPIAAVLAVAAIVHGHPPFFLIPLLWLARAGRRGRFRPGPRWR